MPALSPMPDRRARAPCSAATLRTTPTEKGSRMSEFASAVAGAPSDLTDTERAALLQLAVHNVAALDGITLKAAADLLDRAAATGAAHLAGDAEHVFVTIGGRALVAITREELRRTVAAVR